MNFLSEVAEITMVEHIIDSMAVTFISHIMYSHSDCFDWEVNMKNQHYYSYGLLFSIAPENIYSLHLNDEEGKGDFDWEAYKGDSFPRIVLNFLKTSVTAQVAAFHLADVLNKLPI